jgi:FKBP-type peptidyl-prolyl cis-trans isomerase
MKKLLCCALLLILASCEEAPKPPKKKPREWTKENSYDMNEELAIREDINIRLYLEQHKELKAEETGSGLRYIVLKPGTGPLATTGKNAKASYTIRLLDGEQVYKTADDELEVFRVDQSNVESGIHEGIKKMHVGEKARLVMPSHLAHGLLGDMDNKIPPMSPLIIDIELIAIE